MIERARSEDCVSDLAIDRAIAGELPVDDRALVEAHVAGCDACRGRRNALAADVQAFGTQVFVGMAAEQARSAAGFGTPRWKIYALIGVPLVVFAAVALWIAAR